MTFEIYRCSRSGAVYLPGESHQGRLNGFDDDFVHARFQAISDLGLVDGRRHADDGDGFPVSLHFPDSPGRFDAVHAGCSFLIGPLHLYSGSSTLHSSIFGETTLSGCGEPEKKDKVNILVVEDDPWFADFISGSLALEGFETTVVASGEELFQTVYTKEFDAVVLDLGLPDEDGIVLARKLRARSKLPIIVVTGRKGLEDKLASLSSNPLRPPSRR